MTDVTKPLMTAVLLGLYELVTANSSNPSSHTTHSGGVAAILCAEGSPFDLSIRGNLFQLAHALRSGRHFEVVPNSPAPAPTPSFNPTDISAVAFHQVLRRAEDCLSRSVALAEDLRDVLHQAVLLDKRLALWPTRQSDEWRPRTIQAGSQHPPEGLNFWPPRVDTYYDLYVAAAWNAHRKNRLMLLDKILRLSERLQLKDGVRKLQAEAADLVAAIMASIPYHVTHDLDMQQHLSSSSPGEVSPGKSIGGLLLMHPLYISSNLSIVPLHLRCQMRECLAWIGQNMGIGQATVFSNTLTVFPDESVIHGYVLLWASMAFGPEGHIGA
ncbi:hypothetical protein A1O3_05921 [Capronia epimyces CBS 606.96]|uniref:Transcription factor domain-containing protein n=1 Tax=Capronia epimyces CBS 606.96 TaxID=1182542 RepID=W9Y7L3_9EURO|nr:uncharacterized protein A1O3_05921 [Capronia epimyces CBS 606.96]EXJ85246.1 hypothetical protein A1O3_05921 [Capronia epimyces CBS 606.96]